MKNKVILAVGAHADDTDFGASGTIAKWVKEGATAYYVICTDGSRGSADPKMTHAKLAAIRKKEQEAAAQVLGVKEVYFLNHTDTQLESNQTLKEELVRIIRTVRPHLVITMDPTFYYASTFPFYGDGMGFINHTDHRAASLATMDACFPLARDRLTFLQHEKAGLLPHNVEELWFARFDAVEHVEDISATIDTKIKALACHRSQFNNFNEVEERVRKRATFTGKKKGFAFGENFVRIKIP